MASQSAKIQWLNRQLDAAKIEIESNCVFDDHCQHSTIKHKGIFDADDPYDKPEDYDRNPIYSRDFRDGEGNVNVMIYGPVEREDEQIRKDDKDVHIHMRTNFFQLIHFEDEDDYLHCFPNGFDVEMKSYGPYTVYSLAKDVKFHSQKESDPEYIRRARIHESLMRDRRPTILPEQVATAPPPCSRGPAQCPSAETSNAPYLDLEAYNRPNDNKRLTIKSKNNTRENMKAILKNTDVQRFIRESRGNAVDIFACHWEYRCHHNVDLYRFSWFHGDVSKDEAKARLRGKPAGTFLIRKASSSPPNTDATYKTAYASGANPVLPANATQEYTMDFIDDNGRHQKLRIIKHNEKYQFIESKEKNFSEIWQLVMVVMVIGIEIKDKKSSSGWKRLDVKPLRNKLLPP
ncbi:uncharacterized protein LOC128211572 [Mya arenaria]|uniref:uncharacterized protein LOC128211572 n=1 Tax=Mya arenaria TaxID=6604 RepID=UPI0022E6AB48|nr:uncharacterized protein LOC128211572 [Mya arenaria]